MKRKSAWVTRCLGGGLVAMAVTVSAQTIPTARDQVARPGGQVPGVPPLALVKVADGFNDPVGVTSANDGTGRIFVVERVGRVKVVAKDGRVLPEPFLDLTKTNPLGSEVQTGFVEQGLWSIAFHPKFKENGHVFVHYSSLPFNGASIVARYTVDRASPDRITTEQANKTVKVIMNIPQPYYNHYGGTIAFGPDGYLYVGKGDGGWEGDLLDAGQRLDMLLGKMLRIDVDVPDTTQYRVPPDNPMATAMQDRMMSLFGVTEEGFAKIRQGRPEIWAYGLRNPYMFHFDRRSGDLFIADVGQNHWEEIDYQPKASKGGENYGWRHNEASHCHPLSGPNENCSVVGVLPVAEYPHQEPYPGATKLTQGFGCSAQGLGVANYGGMSKVYLVGDWCSGRLWAVGWNGSRWQLQESLQTNLQFTAGDLDEDGFVLAVNCYCFYLDDKGAVANPPGALWRVMPQSQVPAGAQTAPVVRR
ncbi:MAG TPA: PQQ-dependent sugar dehydrogenase [Methylomirabilota bacterium]